MQTLSDLIAKAQTILDEITQHDSFIKLVEADVWDDPAIMLDDARQALNNIQHAHDNDLKNTPSVTELNYLKNLWEENFKN